MSKENTSTTNTTTTENTDATKGGSDQENKDKAVKTIPYERFSEVNSKLKEAQEKLSKFEADEKAAADKKLLEEKNYQELISKKDKDIESLKAEVATVTKNAKVGEIKNKFIAALSKANAVDANDVLKFVEFEDLIDRDDADTEISKRITDLTKNKSYLFGNGSKRHADENNGIGKQGGDDNKSKSKDNNINIITSLASKLNL